MRATKPFLLLLLAVVLTTAARCEVLGSSESDREALEEARDRWDARDIFSYEYRFRNQCGECLVEFARAYDVRVVDGFVVRVVDAETGAAPPQGYDVLTVPELFALADDAIRRADVFHIEYDRQLGYPTVLSVDWQRQVADDEFVIRVDGLRRIE